jgi:hypothetical protein
MPTVKASIPDHTAVDTSVMDFYFTDADYADQQFFSCIILYLQTVLIQQLNKIIYIR